MKKMPPSIFNDVLGPVMRGPSSSHTAASVRIGRLVRAYFGGTPDYFLAQFEPKGSLATTYHSQGSDMGLAGGLLGLEPEDKELTLSLDLAEQRGLKIEFAIREYPADHPNTYLVEARKGKEVALFRFLSTGGGMISLNQLNGFEVSISGDYFETLFFFPPGSSEKIAALTGEIRASYSSSDYCELSQGDNGFLVNVKAPVQPGTNLLENIATKTGALKHILLPPVLPVISRKGLKVPFSNGAELLRVASRAESEGSYPLSRAGMEYEAARSGKPPRELSAMADYLINRMQGAVRTGLSGTDYSDRILGAQAPSFNSYEGRLFGGPEVKTLISYIAAIMETKSAMGVIVAAPTAGSCGGLPGTLLAAADATRASRDQLRAAFFSAATVGVLIATRSTFAAEECGCQAECGAGSAMAAAGLVELAGGGAKTALDAASMALQNSAGMVCDPVANRVEAPCLGKNIIAGMNALACANMALGGFDALIPFDETLAAFDSVGRALPSSLRCTGKGGLSLTPTALKIAGSLGD